MASADGTIVIDIDIPVNKVRTDSQNIKAILNEIGDHAGDKLDSHFKQNTEKVKRDAESTSREVDSKLSKEVKTKYSIDDSQAIEKVDKIHARIKQLPKEQQTDFNVKDHSGGAFHDIKNRLLGIRDDSEKTKHTFKDMFLGSTLGGLASNLISSAWGHITGGIHSAIDAAKQYALEQQTMNATWLTLTNSAAKGKAMVNQINNMAVAAQNSTEMVDQLSQKFYAINNNAKQTGQLTKSILTLQDAFGQTDAAVENFGTQFSQMMANGKVSAQDMMSIVNTFPKLRPMLLDYERRIHHNSHMTMAEVNKMMSDGKIKSQDMINVVLEAGKKFNKATGNFTKTIPGMARVVKSQMPVLLGAFTKPFAKMESPVYAAVAKWVSSKKTNKEFQTLGKTVSSGMNNVMKAFSGGKSANVTKALDSAINGINSGLKGIFGWISGHANDLKTIGSSIASIGGQLAKAVWKDFASIITTIGNMFGVTAKNGKKSGGAVHALAGILNAVAKQKGAIKAIADAIVAIAVVKGLGRVSGGLFGIGKKGYSAYKNVKMLLKGMQGIQDIKDLSKTEKAFLNLGNGIRKAGGKFLNAGKSLGSKVVQGIKASMKFGMGKRLAVGALAGAAVATPEVINAVKDRHSADKRSKDIGGAVGALAGGTLTSMIPVVGPMLAPIGAIIGKYAGRWGGEAVNNFTKGWQRKKPPKKFWSLENLGWSAHDMFNKVGKWGSQVGKYFASGIKKGKSFVKKNSKELVLTAISPILGIPALLYKNNPKFRKWVKGIGKTFKEGFNQAKKHVHDSIKGILGFINDLRQKGKSKLHQFTSWIGDNWNRLKKSSSKVWNKIKDSVTENAEKAKQSGSKNFSKLQSVMGDIGKDIKKQWHSLWNGLADFFGDIWKSIKKTASGGINGVVGVINGGISGIDNVIHSFGGKSHAISLIPKVKLATGTLGNSAPSITQPTLALLNDGHDSPETNNRETIWDTNTGALGVVNGTNVPFILQPGMEVFSASQSRNLGFTHFAKGTNPLAGIGNFFGGIGSWIGQKTNQLKKWFELATKIVSHPIQALSSLMQPSSKGLNGIFMQLGKGMFDKSKGAATSWWSALWNMASSKLNGDGGPATGLLKAVEKYGEGKKYVWGAAGPSSFDCSGLVMYALKHAYGIDFPHFSGSQYGMIQPISRDQAKMGDLVFWGNHGDEHEGVYGGGNKYFSAQSPSQGIHMNTLDSVVGYGKPLFGRVRGLSQSSSTKETVKATNSLQKMIKGQVGNGFFKFLSKLGSLFSFTGGEAGMPTGDHTHWMKQAHIPRSDWSGLNYIISAESGWNPNARNPSSGTYGLGQMQGYNLHYYTKHGGKSNAIAQLMGIMDYIHDRYGSVAKAVSFRKSHNWYGNGGITSGPELAVVGEDGIERIINVMKPSADALIDNTIKARAQVAPESPSAKLAKLIDFNSVKYSQANGYGRPQDSKTRTVINQVGSNQSSSADGDVYIDVHADSARLARVVYPKVKILQGKDLDIAGAGGAIV